MRGESLRWSLGYHRMHVSVVIRIHNLSKSYHTDKLKLRNTLHCKAAKDLNAKKKCLWEVVSTHSYSLPPLIIT